MSLRQWAAEWLEQMAYRVPERRSNLTKEQAAIASWAVAEPARIQSIVDYLSSRVEVRGSLPTPANPHDLAIQAGRDKECRELAQVLLFLTTYPSIAVGSEDGVRGGPN